MSIVRYNLLSVIREMRFLFIWCNTKQQPGGKFYYGDNDYSNSSTAALYFCVNVSAENYGYEKDGSTHHPEWEANFNKYVHILVTSKDNVFVAFTDDRKSPENIPIESWKNTSNHDSCWFGDGVESYVDEAVKQADEFVNGHVPKEHANNSVDVCFEDIGSNIFSFYDIIHVSVQNGWRKIMSIKPLVFNFSLKEK